MPAIYKESAQLLNGIIESKELLKGYLQEIDAMLSNRVLTEDDKFILNDWYTLCAEIFAKNAKWDLSIDFYNTAIKTIDGLKKDNDVLLRQATNERFLALIYADFLAKPDAAIVHMQNAITYYQAIQESLVPCNELIQVQSRVTVLLNESQQALQRFKECNQEKNKHNHPFFITDPVLQGKKAVIQPTKSLTL